MATKLKKLFLTSVDLVRAGANQEADICLYKSAEATESPVEEEKNLLKRFLDFLHKTPAEAESEPTGDIEKAEEPQPDDLSIYKSTITESLQSILADEGLSNEEKSAMLAKSIGEYHDAMVELLKGEPEAPSEEEEPVEKAEPEIVELEELEKADPFVEIEVI